MLLSVRRRTLARLVPLAVLAFVAPLGGAALAQSPSDPASTRQWALPIIGAPTAWETTTGAGVRIGIVDSGANLTHEDLQTGKIAAHTACIDTTGDPRQCKGSGQDIDGHGTHVSGIAAANKDNGRGVAGVAPDAQLLVARVFDGEGASINDVVAGIKWAVDNGARVVNLSLGEAIPVRGELGGGDTSLREGIEYAWARGAVAVLAAGNTNILGFGSANYGAMNAVVVGATGRMDEISSYSSETGNAKWALVAPGGNRSRGGEASTIFSTYWEGGGPNNLYAYLQGTSMAAPQVAGALALLLSRPGMTNQRAVDLLLASANRNVKCGPNSDNCVGRLDVAKAIAMTGAAAPTAAPAPAPTTGTDAAAPAPAGGGSTATTRAPAPTTAPRIGTPTTATPPPTSPSTAAEVDAAPPAEPAAAPEAAPSLETVDEAPDDVFAITSEGAVNRRPREKDSQTVPVAVAFASLAGAAILVFLSFRRRSDEAAPT